MKFVVDAQLPPALARLSREAGCDASAVREIGLREASDAEIWRYAVQQQAATITKDEDFAERCLYSRDQPVIVWLRIGNTSNQGMLRRLVPLWPEIMRRIELGDRLIEELRDRLIRPGGSGMIEAAGDRYTPIPWHLESTPLSEALAVEAENHRYGRKYSYTIPREVLQFDSMNQMATTSLASIFSGKSESAIRSGLSYEKD